MDNQKTKLMIMELFALKGRAYTEFIIATWAKVLNRFTEPQLKRAFAAALQKTEFFEIKTILDELIPSRDVIAGNAWDQLETCAANGGEGYQEIPEGIRQVLQKIGSMEKLRFTDNGFQKSEIRKRFLEEYKKSPDIKAVDYTALFSQDRELPKLASKETTPARIVKQREPDAYDMMADNYQGSDAAEKMRYYRHLCTANSTAESFKQAYEVK